MGKGRNNFKRYNQRSYIFLQLTNLNYFNSDIKVSNKMQFLISILWRNGVDAEFAGEKHTPFRDCTPGDNRKNLTCSEVTHGKNTSNCSNGSKGFGGK
ncbi:hypothetical protein POVCU2_0044680 [Plasmodium ovale curtisi]|uniref:Uncharacterized protein n=1 Tax=Plasmodium ovale curtisi TaxID=864141 RepID=A0A1A8W804_PLAOA|nr:hypothetical protein POVCU2_0044680 [Plasmodium ovale curtisi]